MKVMINKKYFAVFAAVFFCLSVMTANAEGGDEKTPGNGVEDPTPASKLTVGKVISSKSNTDKKKYVFKGTVTDVQTNQPVKGAKITMKGTDVAVVSDAYGLYLFTIPDNLVKDNMFFEINFPGYERKSFFINKDFLPLLEQSVDGRIKRFMVK